MRCPYFQLFALFLFLFLIQSSLLAQADSLKAGIYYQQAEALLLKGKPNKAIKSFRKALKIN